MTQRYLIARSRYDSAGFVAVLLCGEWLRPAVRRGRSSRATLVGPRPGIVDYALWDVARPLSGGARRGAPTTVSTPTPLARDTPPGRQRHARLDSARSLVRQVASEWFRSEIMQVAHHTRAVKVWDVTNASTMHVGS